MSAIKLNPVDFTNAKRQKLIEVGDHFNAAKGTLEDTFTKFSDRISQEITVEKDVQVSLADMSTFLSQQNVEDLKTQMQALQASIQQKVDDLKQNVLETNRLADEVHSSYEEVVADLKDVDDQMAAIGATMTDLTAFLDLYRESSPSA